MSTFLVQKIPPSAPDPSELRCFLAIGNLVPLESAGPIREIPDDWSLREVLDLDVGKFVLRSCVIVRNSWGAGGWAGNSS